MQTIKALKINSKGTQNSSKMPSQLKIDRLGLINQVKSVVKQINNNYKKIRHFIKTLLIQNYIV